MSVGEGSAPWLVLERVERDPAKPERLTAFVTMAGHDLRLTVEPDGVGGLRHVDFPPLLGLHEPSRKAAVLAIWRISDGEPAELPLDLTGQIRHADPPFLLAPHTPTAQERQFAAEADAINVEIVKAERTDSDPIEVHGDVLVDGRPASVHLSVYVTPGSITIRRRLPGHDKTLTVLQDEAVQHALMTHFGIDDRSTWS
jgi:hypothetical protein